MPTLADSVSKLKCQRNRRHSPAAALPTGWLMTDERLANPLACLAGLPVGTGVIVRAKTPAALRTLALALRPLARRRRLPLLIAGDWRLAARLRVDGVHLPEAQARYGMLAGMRLWHKQGRQRLLTVACHDRAGLARAKALNASACTLSPLFATRSHPGSRTWGITRASLLIGAQATVPVMALGGINPLSAQTLNGRGFSGLAAIDGWSG